MPATTRTIPPSATAPQDIALMQRIAERDPAALRELYDRHAGLIYAIALKMLKSRDEADDLVTDLFWELWNKSARYDVTRAAPVTYMVTLARSRCIDRLRRSNRHKASSLDSQAERQETDAPSPLEGALLDENRGLVRQAMSRLDANQRQALESAYFEGLTHSEIAEKLGKPLGTVKTYIRQGLIRLREALRKTDRVPT
ncbi:MAG TPA: sigma-70 family RNA polymerase sigma factor [Tepidisphaeraceae bacterium]|jgi:RNA polymerase sigma-70 factor (ECF subfamily)